VGVHDEELAPDFRSGPAERGEISARIQWHRSGIGNGDGYRNWDGNGIAELGGHLGAPCQAITTVCPCTGLLPLLEIVEENTVETR
jgi:hypothetical protein